VLDELGRPDAVTLTQIREKADLSLTEWLSERKNRRAIPFRLEACGYISVRNPDDRHDGRWPTGKVRQVIYAKATLTPAERVQAATARAKVGP
jgi:hypothetical protein